MPDLLLIIPIVILLLALAYAALGVVVWRRGAR